MKIYPDKNQEDEVQPVNKVMDFTQTSYHKFSGYVAFRDDDPIWMLTYKLIMRFIGIIFLIMISPFVAVGLIIAILVAS